MPSRYYERETAGQLTLENILRYLKLRWKIFRLTEKSASLNEWLEDIGTAPFGMFDKKGNYLSQNGTNGCKSPRTEYWGNVHYTHIEHPLGPDNAMQVLHLSDVEFNRINAPWLKKYAMLQEQKFDMILITGDTVLDSGEYLDEGAQSFLRSLNSDHKYAVPGNHDGKTWKEWSKISEKLEKAGFCDLSFRTTEIIEINGHMYQITGFPDRSLYPEDRFNSWEEGYKSTLENYLSDKTIFKIALFHRPDDINYEIPEEAFNLILAGHEHSGEIRMAGIDGVIWPGIKGESEVLNGIGIRYLMPTQHSLISVTPGARSRLELQFLGYSFVFPRIGTNKPGPEIYTICSSGSSQPQPSYKT